MISFMEMDMIFKINFHGLGWPFNFVIQMKEKNKEKNARVKMRLKNIFQKL